MSISRQHVTVQIGSYSNFIGSHYWNIQERKRESCDNGDETFQLGQLYRQNNNGSDSEGVWGHVNSLNAYDSAIEEESCNVDTSIWNEAVMVIREDEDKDEDEDEDEENDEDDRYSRSERQEAGVSAQSVGRASVTGTWVGRGGDSHHIDRDAGYGGYEDEDEDDESNIRDWTDFLTPEVQLHARSVSVLPLWRDSTAVSVFGQHHASNHPFLTFLSGRDRTLIPNESREAYLDHFRYLLEECDWLGEVDVLLDVESGFGGLGCELLEDIREELPHVPMPVFASMDPYSAPAPGGSTRSLSLPLLYSSLLKDTASVVVPLDPLAALSNIGNSPNVFTLPRPSSSSQYTLESPFRSSSVLALSLDALLGHRSLRSESESAPDTHWIAAASGNGRFPLCQAEICLPFPLKVTDSLDPLWETFPSSFRPAASPFFSSHSSAPQLPRINPFMHSLSPICSVSYTDAASLSRTDFRLCDGVWSIERTRRPFTNALSFRGPSSADLRSSLFAQCIDSKYLLSQLQQRQTPMYLPHWFPRLFQHVDQNGFPTRPANMPPPPISSSPSASHAPLGPRDGSHSRSLDYGRPTHTSTDSQSQSQSRGALQAHRAQGVAAGEQAVARWQPKCISVAAAVGCDSVTGSHLAEQARRWASAVRAGCCRGHLERVGMEADEAGEVTETLLQMSERYGFD